MGVQASPIIIVASGGVPVVNTDNGTPFTVAANAIGTPMTVVTNNGAPVKLFNEDGTAWEPAP